MIPKALANAIIVLVSIAFAMNFGAVFIVPGWRPDPYIYGIFMTVVGGSFALRQRNFPRGGDRE